jgi:hypothetical protein
MQLNEDEIRLIELVREIKSYGFGELFCTIASKEIMSVKQTYTKKFN